MLKICGDTINKLLELIFKQALITSTYPSDWKRDKQNIKNYHPVSLLPICSKVFESILFNNMLSFFSKK